jgi:choline dehydrogenase
MKMLRQVIISLSFVLGGYARYHKGNNARIIDCLQLSNETIYDFVVAGGGIAGLTVADRLTENPNGLLYQSITTGPVLIVC